MYTRYNYPYYITNQNDNRLVGGFAAPFLLGGLTGAIVAPAFMNRPYYNNYYYPYPNNYYYYGGYYR